jgi:hypothetical protein
MGDGFAMLHRSRRVAHRINKTSEEELQYSASWRDRTARRSSAASLCFHHLQPRIEFMAAAQAADAIRLNRKFIGSDSHASTVGTTGQMNFDIIEGFVLGATEAIDRFPVE